jgi:hypothetical protein
VILQVFTFPYMHTVIDSFMLHTIDIVRSRRNYNGPFVFSSVAPQLFSFAANEPTIPFNVSKSPPRVHSSSIVSQQQQKFFDAFFSLMTFLIASSSSSSSSSSSLFLFPPFLSLGGEMQGCQIWTASSPFGLNVLCRASGCGLW